MGFLRKSRTKEDEQALTAQAGSKADASRQDFPRLGWEFYAAIAHQPVNLRQSSAGHQLKAGQSEL
jgi:hypothetical protein